MTPLGRVAGSRRAKPTERLLRAAFAGGLRLRRTLKRLIATNPRLDRLLADASNRDAFDRTYAYDVMLADEVRTRTFARGIAANVREGDVVLDLGTGLGVLACLAARERPRKVYAIDHVGLDLARTFAEANGFGEIEFSRAHSADFEPDEPVDVIVQDLIGGAIFDAHMLTSVAELRERVLRPGGRIVPGRFDVHFEPAQLRADMVVPLIWEHRVAGLDFSRLRPLVAGRSGYPPPRGARPESFERLLCDPEPAFSIDLERHGPDDLPSRIRYRRPVVDGGVQHGFAVYFVAHFDDTHRLTNAPLEPPTHWSPILLRTETCARERGETIELDFHADPFERPGTWRWQVDGGS